MTDDICKTEVRSHVFCFLHITFELLKCHWALYRLCWKQDPAFVHVFMCDAGRQRIVKHILSGLTGHCQVQLPSPVAPADTGSHTQKSTCATMLIQSDRTSCWSCKRLDGMQGKLDLHLPMLFHLVCTLTYLGEDFFFFFNFRC